MIFPGKLLVADVAEIHESHQFCVHVAVIWMRNCNVLLEIAQSGVVFLATTAFEFLSAVDCSMRLKN